MYKWFNAQEMADFVANVDGPVCCQYQNTFKIVGTPAWMGWEMSFITEPLNIPLGPTCIALLNTLASNVLAQPLS